MKKYNSINILIGIGFILTGLLFIVTGFGFSTIDKTNKDNQITTETKAIQVDTLCQVIIFRDSEGKRYITTKYKQGEYIDMCEPLGIIVREADRMCNVPKKVIPSNAIPKRVQYSGHINGY